jgi:TRAP transporter TAXI family solute receptor
MGNDDVGAAARRVTRRWWKQLRRWELVGIALPLLALVIGGFVLAWQFVQPAPPNTVVLAAGAKGGAYWQFAQKYADYFARNGITLEVRETAGAVENLRLLLDRSSDVDVAILQGGLIEPSHAQTLLGVCAIDLEPLWVLFREEAAIRRLDDLAGRRLAIGAAGSGTRFAALHLLDAVGLVPREGSPPTTRPADARPVPTLVDVGGREAARQLRAGEVDAAFFVASAQTGYLLELLAEPGIAIHPLERAEAIAKRYPFVHAVRLPEGVVDLQRNIPAKDVSMIAVTAGLVARSDTHSGVVQLLVQAAVEAHRDGTVITEIGQFPNADLYELPLSSVAAHQLRTGPNWLQRHMPFWASSLVSRLWVLLLPLLTLAIPLVRLAPVFFRWRTRSKIYRWYKRVRRLDEIVADPAADRLALQAARNEVSDLDARISEVNVPLSYMDEFYELRMHLQLVGDRLDRRLVATTPTEQQVLA